MDLDYVELDDWELLQSEETRGFEVINNDSGVLIRPDYFDSKNVLIQESSGVCSDDGLVDEFEDGFVEKSGIEVGFDGVGEIDGSVVENEKSEVGFIGKSELEVGFDGVGEIDVGVVKNENSEVGLIEKSELEAGFDGVEEFVVRDLGVAESDKIEGGFVEKSELDLSFDGVGEIEVRDLGFAENESSEVDFLEKGGMVEEIVGKDLGVAENEEIEVGLVGGINETEGLGVGNTEMSDGADTNLRDELVAEGGDEGVKHCDDADIVSGEKESGGEGEKRIMWWKLPFEFLKYCVLRTSPVWTVSMAAAVIGFVILGRRYYSMKRKSKSVQVKVTMDDKKISQFKSRVVRLNEAFSAVKHVPIIRHSLPAAGVTPWPAMTSR